MDITKIEILGSGELAVQPDRVLPGLFEYIYRAAAEVSWDAAERRFMTPVPRERSYDEWFQHLVAIVSSELGVKLRITERTEWVNIAGELRRKMEESQRGL